VDRVDFPPRRVAPFNENADPARPKLRTERDEPMEEKSKRERAPPIRAKLLTEKLEPRLM
jgi:hypothetical protein